MGKDQEFLDAARNGNILLIEKVLNQKAKRSGPLASLRRGPGVNIQDSSGYSALHHACLNGHCDIVRILLAHEASPNLLDSRGSSPLHLAAWAGHEDIVKMLLIHPYRPANPNMQTVENETPLHCAAQHGHIGALNALLAHNADPNVLNNRNESPLDLAAQYGRLQAVQMLIRAHPELISPYHDKSHMSHESSTFNHTCLHLASRNGHKNVVEVLLAAGVNVNICTPSGTALHEAALCGKESVVRILLHAGVDINVTDAEGRTALDILKEFPPHVTRGIISVINNYRNQSDGGSYQSETDITLKQQGGIYTQPNKRQHINRYHFNSNNHLLNHSLQQSMQYSNVYNKCRASKSGKSLDSGLLLPYEMIDFKKHENMESPLHSTCNYSQNDMAISPTSSMSSFEPVSVSPRSRSSTGGMGVARNSNNNSSAPPKKPPRRNLSVSPTHYAQQFSYASPNHKQAQHSNARRQPQAPQPPLQSPDGASHIMQRRTRGDRMYGSVREASHVRSSDDYEYMIMARSESTAFGNNLSTSSSSDMLSKQYQCADQSSVLNSEESEATHNSTTRPISSPLTLMNLSVGDRVNPIFKSYNPNRKLKRNRDGCFLGDRQRFSVTSTSSELRQNDPQSPTNYQQPPTPEHPPPSVNQAEISIYERIRPLSQEYKRRSALGLLPHQQKQCIMIESSTSPPPKSITEPKLEPVTTPRMSSTEIKGRSQLGLQVCANSEISLQNYHSPDKHGSSGSLSSNVSHSDCSVSTDCVEEYIGDEPFAGLFRGSTIHLNIVKKDQEQHCLSTSALKQKGFRSQNHQDLHVPETENNNTNESFSDMEHQQRDDDVGVDKTRKQRIKNYLERRNESGFLHEATSGPTMEHSESSVLSPFNEEEAWEKISEIIESFGSGILNDDPHDNAFNSNLFLFDFDDIDMPAERNELVARLQSVGLLHLERTLFENGYDHYKFMNGVLDDTDIPLMNVGVTDATNLLRFVCSLPMVEFQPYVQPRIDAVELEQQLPKKGVSSLDDWLKSIELLQYKECFNKHLYNSIVSVSDVWDVELLTVLEINKLGHRRRILKSLAYMRENSVVKRPLSGNNETNCRLSCNGEVMPQPKHQQTNRNLRHAARKIRPAPPPPNVPSFRSEVHILEIRAPSELLLGLPNNLRTKWRHSAIALVNEHIKYEVKYMGSTLVKELHGTESTRKSIQKFKRISAAAGCGVSRIATVATVSSVPTSTNARSEERNHQQQRLPTLYTNNNNNPKSVKTNFTPHQPHLVCLSISHRGVEFIDIASKSTICEHEIQNINCACQDAGDLSFFAYITREEHMHYCHVFHVSTADSATEIILTLGQAFEVAYQLAIREDSSSLAKITNGGGAGDAVGLEN